MAVAEIQTGTAVINGITNGGTAISITGYATFLLDTSKLAHNFDLKDIKDALGFDACLIATNEYLELTFNFTPSGASRAAAAAVYAVPTPLSKITLANFKVTPFNGDWVYVGGTNIDLAAGNPGKISSVKCRKYADSTQNTALTTTVSG